MPESMKAGVSLKPPDEVILTFTPFAFPSLCLEGRADIDSDTEQDPPPERPSVGVTRRAG